MSTDSPSRSPLPPLPQAPVRVRPEAGASVPHNEPREASDSSSSEEVSGSRDKTIIHQVVGVEGFSGSYQPEKTLMDGSPMEVKKMAQALLNFIADDECSEVLMNGPKEISRKIGGTRYQCPEINFSDADTYHQVINEVVLRYCADTDDRIDGKTVMIEGQLELPSPISGRAPMLARVHIIAPPGVSFAKVTIAKKPRVDLTLDDLAGNNTLSQNEADFLKACAFGRKTIVVSGATGSGKTTLLQAITHHFDANDRVVVIEETPELRLPFGDVVYLRATPERPGQDPEDIYDLAFWTKQSNRMRMDRVIVGEIRGAEMSDWLMAANSGAEGSATTVHANSSRRCLDKILGMATKSFTSTSEGQLRREIATTIDLIVQVGVVDGRHVVMEIEEISNTVTQQTELIMTNPIFGYDKAHGTHVSKGRPSDDFIESLEAQGVSVNNAWFRN